MTSCGRFEEEGVLQLEQGLPLDSHFASCPDCRAARAAHNRLRQELASAGAKHEPPPLWQARVWAAIEQRKERREWRLPWVLAPVAAAVVGAFYVGMLTYRGLTSEVPSPAGLYVDVQPGEGTPRRGDEARPGDRLTLQASTGGARYAELRVYLDDAELVLWCSTDPPCTWQGDSLHATLALSSVGSYQSLLLVSNEPLPEPSHGLDIDAGAALAAGAIVELGDNVRVQ